MNYIDIAKIVAIAAAHLYLTWVFFVAIMRLKELKDFGVLTKESNPVVWYLGLITLGIGLVLDFVLNMAITILGLELPHEYLLSARLTRWHNSEPGSWWNRNIRKSIAKLGSVMLDMVDPSGKHI